MFMRPSPESAAAFSAQLERMRSFTSAEMHTLLVQIVARFWEGDAFLVINEAPFFHIVVTEMHDGQIKGMTDLLTGLYRYPATQTYGIDLWLISEPERAAWEGLLALNAQDLKTRLIGEGSKATFLLWDWASLHGRRAHVFQQRGGG